jgi:hypothetical protein
MLRPSIASSPKEMILLTVTIKTLPARVEHRLKVRINSLRRIRKMIRQSKRLSKSLSQRRRG